MQRQCTLTVIDLGFFARQEFESVELGRLGLLQRPAEALDAVVATGKAVLVDQVLIDRRCITPQPNLRFDPAPMRLAGRAGIRRSRWPGWRNLRAPTPEPVAMGEFASQTPTLRAILRMVLRSIPVLR
jgi:hypothetical protein